MRKRWLGAAVLPLAFAMTAGATSASTDTTTAGSDTTAAGSDTTTAGGADTTAAAGSDTTQAPTATYEATAVAVGDIDLKVDEDLSGTTVTLYGPESNDAEGGSITDVLTAFAEANDMTINYVGAREFEEQIRTQVGGGNPPDIGVFPQPGNVADFARSGDIVPVPQDIVDATAANWSPDWMNFWQVDGQQYALPNKSDLKSLVWYVPSAFAEAGYTVPETWTDFVELTGQMIENGDTPLCVGVESGPATGWPFTDWVEELVLRQQGADIYDQWVSHEIPFNSPEIVDTMAEVADLWNTEGMVFANGGSIVSTPFGDNAQPLVDGDCMMHRQASFFAASFPEGTEFGQEEGQVDVFYFPSDEGRPVEVGGTGVAAFRDAPEVWAVMKFMASPEYASLRQQAQAERKDGGISGFLTAVQGVDTSLFLPLEQSFIEILQTGDPARFDASDLMPGEVGSGTFWSEGVKLIQGDVDAQQAADAIEASWPASASGGSTDTTTAATTAGSDAATATTTAGTEMATATTGG